MIEDEINPHSSEAVPASRPSRPANDNGPDLKPVIDPRILSVARAIGRQIAREQLDQLEAANDNTPDNT